jgi:hypothetical protein
MCRLSPLVMTRIGAEQQARLSHSMKNVHVRRKFLHLKTVCLRRVTLRRVQVLTHCCSRHDIARVAWHH